MEGAMKVKQALYCGVAAAALALVAPIAAMARTVAIKAAEIGGVVTGASGPEAGVWVIAETTDLPTKFARIVVTDEQGRYVIPDLRKANYTVWVRGYGLIDSQKVQAAPGKLLNLTATPAPSEAAAAEYYPGMYWYSLLQIPDKGQFPGTGARGNGIPEFMKSQNFWIDTVKNSCQSCHALGDKGMRTLSRALGDFKTSTEPHRRSRRRLEGQGRVDHIGHPHRVPRRRRHERAPQGVQAAGEAKPARGLRRGPRKFGPRHSVPSPLAGEGQGEGACRMRGACCVARPLTPTLSREGRGGDEARSR
jgi:hypothetical protein